MFVKLAKFSVKFRWFIIIAWIIAVPVIVKSFPSLESVSKSKQHSILTEK